MAGYQQRRSTAMESDPGSGLRMTEPHAGEHARRPSPRGAPHSPFRQSTGSHLALPGRIDACEFFCAVRASRFLRLLPLLRCPCSAPGSVRQSRSIASTDNSGIRLLTPARLRGRRKTARPASTGTRYPMCAGRWVSSSPPFAARAARNTTESTMADRTPPSPAGTPIAPGATLILTSNPGDGQLSCSRWFPLPIWP